MTRTTTTKNGEHWDEISKRIYGDEKYFGFLMEHNPGYLENYAFRAGVVLRTPELPEDVRDAPSWRI